MNTDMIADVMGAESERDAARREVAELRAACDKWSQASATGMESIARLQGENERLTRERDDERRERLFCHDTAEARQVIVARLRAEVAMVNGHVFQRDAEIARLRALLKGALVPCDRECEGTEYCGVAGCVSGFVPFRGEP